MERTPTLKFNDKPSQALSFLKYGIPWIHVFHDKDCSITHPQMLTGPAARALFINSKQNENRNLFKDIKKIRQIVLNLGKLPVEEGFPTVTDEEAQSYAKLGLFCAQKFWVYLKDNGVVTITEVIVAGANPNSIDLEVHFGRKIKLSKRTGECIVYQRVWGNKIVEKYCLNPADEPEETDPVYYVTSGKTVFSVTETGVYSKFLCNIGSLMVQEENKYWNEQARNKKINREKRKAFGDDMEVSGNTSDTSKRVSFPPKRTKLIKETI